ncbi:HAD family phosphatase [Maribellus sp. YY47]|uniref:HAD family hydrolase n=1 Tax=Maribellus sp. YY47 TaxID=2929486 RepID=UPI0020019D44|nr:HAD family phosphatase [Maribellus sp. YY47]MCK3682810.1 HAD family phosphatase [Maribellus sp. YY47]
MQIPLEKRFPRAVIFDMDGVLVDSEPYHIEIENRMFSKMKLDISDEEHATYMGTATDVMWRQIIEKRNLSLDAEEMTRLTNREGVPFFSGLDKLDPMPGLIRLLDFLKSKSVPMAVASSSDPETVKIIIEKSGLRKYFKHTISSGTVGKSKPSPDVFLHVAKLLDVEPEDCLVIEDSKNGIRAAKSAGMYCVAYSGAATRSQDQSEADLVIDDFEKLKAILFESMT